MSYYVFELALVQPVSEHLAIQIQNYPQKKPSPGGNPIKVI